MRTTCPGAQAWQATRSDSRAGRTFGSATTPSTRTTRERSCATTRAACSTPGTMRTRDTRRTRRALCLLTGSRGTWIRRRPRRLRGSRGQTKSRLRTRGRSARRPGTRAPSTAWSRGREALPPTPRSWMAWAPRRTRSRSTAPARAACRRDRLPSMPTWRASRQTIPGTRSRTTRSR